MKKISSSALQKKETEAMKEVANQDLRWPRNIRCLALILGLLILGLAIVAMFYRGGDILPFWQIILPFLMGLIGGGGLGYLLNLLSKKKALAALPGISFPFQWMMAQFGLAAFLILYVESFYFLSLLAPESLIMRVLGSVWVFLIALVALFVFTTGGGQVIINISDNEIVYRDTVSKGKLSRQDWLYSLSGHWDQGLLVGYKRFPFADMESLQVLKTCVLIRGKEQGFPYLLILYTPRIQEQAKEACQGKVEGELASLPADFADDQ